MRAIRASEISAYLYCQRAWWYQKNGEPSTNLDEMIAGSELHYRHGRAAFRLGCMRAIAFGLILLALTLAAVYFTNRLI
jgi:CRISPR/Cas system-associated exonuclease Cas4 (RecB family)